ncbi:M55 family metallopeptidase [Clostridiaceae bacterium M8S5]|nr:M55 family metallopeptidase [Clostridiaceae bacterium M8S5]
MKVYVSTDIEGVTGCNNWNETTLGHSEYALFQEQMTNEVKAACEGINEAFDSNVEIVVKDSHDSGRNIIMKNLPENVKLIRGWTSDPNIMIGGIDESFDALVYIGYHSGAGENGNPLSHSMNLKTNYITVNGLQATEYLLHTYAASEMGIPVVFLSGDAMLCESAKIINPSIETVAVKEGLGDSTISLNPNYACSLIKEKIKIGLSKINECIVNLPDSFEVEINYQRHQDARKASFYPGVTLINNTTVKFVAETARDMMVTIFFIL